jgi:hypothetical protein
LSELKVECFVPFAKNNIDSAGNRAEMIVSLVEHKLVTKVSKLRVTLPISVLSEVYTYRDSLRKYRKMDSSESDEKSSDSKTPPQSSD